MTKKKVEPTFGSIFRAVEEKAKKTSFLHRKLLLNKKRNHYDIITLMPYTTKFD